MTMVGLFGSVKNATEVGSGTVLIPPSLTFILQNGVNGLLQFRQEALRTHFKQMLA